IGTGEFRRIHSRVSWMFLPVERSMTVSAPQRVAHVIFSTSSSMDEATAELPMLALIFTRNLRPMIIGSVSGWLTLAGRIARPRDLGGGIGMGTARVVEADGRVSAREGDLADRHAEVGPRAGEVDLLGSCRSGCCHVGLPSLELTRSGSCGRRR